MGLTVSEGVKRKPAPAGTHGATCFGVIDLGTQPAFKPGDNPRHKIWMWWELCEETTEDGKPVTIGEFYGASIGKKSTLRPVLEGWRGKAFTEEELKVFHMSAVVGKACMVTVIHERKNDETRDKVKSVTGLPKGMSRPVPRLPVVTLDLDKDKFDRGVYDALPNFLKDMIAKSPEGKALGLSEGSKQWPDKPADDYDENGKPIRNGVTVYDANDPDIPF